MIDILSWPSRRKSKRGRRRISLSIVLSSAKGSLNKWWWIWSFRDEDEDYVGIVRADVVGIHEATCADLRHGYLILSREVVSLSDVQYGIEIWKRALREKIFTTRVGRDRCDLLFRVMQKFMSKRSLKWWGGRRDLIEDFTGISSFRERDVESSYRYCWCVSWSDRKLYPDLQILSRDRRFVDVLITILRAFRETIRSRQTGARFCRQRNESRRRLEKS